MKKIILLLLVFSLFFTANIFAEEEKTVSNFDNDQLYSFCREHIGTDDSKNSAKFKEKYAQAVKYFFEEKNYKKAYKLLKDIIKKDSDKERASNSKVMLIVMYLNGLDVEKDYDKALSLGQEILKENDSSYPLYSDVLFLVGGMLFVDARVDMDFDKTVSLIKEAVSLGNEEAKKLLEKIETEGINEDNLGEKLYGLKELKLFFKKEKKIMRTVNLIEVVQVVSPNVAVAGMGYMPDGEIVLIIGGPDDKFYEKQNIRIPPGKKIKQIGTVKLQFKLKNQGTDGAAKIVPAVVIK